MKALHPSGSKRKAITKTKPITVRMLCGRLFTVAREAGLEADELNLQASIYGRHVRLTTDNLEVDEDGTLILDLSEEANYGQH